MKAWERLLEVASGQRGFVTPTDAEAVEVNPVELRKMARRGRLEHPTWGVYRFVAFPRAENDELLMAVLWTGGRGAISHESALALHELCDVNPRYVHITVPPGCRPSRRGGEDYRVHHEQLEDSDLDECHGIPVVVPKLAIAQAAAAGTDPELIAQAIATARQRGLIDRHDEEQLRGGFVSAGSR